MWQWRTSMDGIVEVDSGVGVFSAIMLPGPNTATAKTEKWLGLAREKAALYGVPLSWILGVIYSESAGNPTARDSISAGLMQLTLKVYGISESQAFTPEINVDLGTKTLGGYKTKGFDLPSTASMYNAGPSKNGGPKKNSTDPWGLAETRPAVPYTGYIEKVVRASNWWRDRELAGETLGGPTTGPLPAPDGPPEADRPETLMASLGSSNGLLMAAGALAGWELYKQWKRRA